MKVSSLTKIAAALLVATTLTACDGDDGNDGAQGPAGQAGVAGPAGQNGTDGTDGVTNLVTRDDVIKTNANIAYAAYSDSLITAREMHQVLETFVNNPTAENMQAAREAWLAAREPYGQTEVYRFREGPIDALKEDGTIGQEGDGPEGQINAWPLAESIIDYVATEVDGTATADAGTIAGGIIFNDTVAPTINKEAIADFFENQGDEANVTTGYHAIEFLLWGQDLNEDLSGNGPRDMSGGQRPVTDYFRSAADGDAQNGTICTAGRNTAAQDVAGDAYGSCVRRGQYLLAASELLIDDLERIVNAWQPGVSDNHYANFVAGGDASLRLMLDGMGSLSLGELAGERMRIALRDNSQEDEHSCFADNTHRDIFLNAKGVQNTFTGSYTRVNGEIVSGASLQDYLVVQEQPELANTLRAALEDTMVKASVISDQALAGMPFDNLIQPSNTAGNAMVNAVIASLEAQTESIENVVSELNLPSINTCEGTETGVGNCPQ